jgi:succinyl-diaminopimelate desuccinylase
MLMVLQPMDKSRILALLKDLIAAKSENPPGYEADAAKVLRDHLEAHGISCTTVGPKERPNLIFSSHEGEKGDLVMHGHLDTVPIGNIESWSHDPFASEIVEGKLYGRGSADMKGPVAALAETLILYTQAKHDKPLVMLATSDEESGCSGAEEVAASGQLSGIKFGVCAEPTGLGILIGEKGLFWSKIVSSGKSAHGSRPEEGVNAIEACMDAIKVLTGEPFPHDENALLGEPTLNIGVIKGGIKINVVPDSCEALLDMRIVMGQDPDSLLVSMNSRLEYAGLSDRVKVEYVHGKPAVLTSENSEIVSVAEAAVKKVRGQSPELTTATYGTDCSVLQPKVGIQHIICGPGSIEQAHQPDEFIRLDELYQAVDIYSEIADHFSG